MISNSYDLGGTHSKQATAVKGGTTSVVESMDAEPEGVGTRSLPGGHATDPKTERYRDLDRIKDAPPSQEEVVPKTDPKNARTESETTVRARLAKKMFDTVASLSVDQPLYSASKVQLLKNQLVESHRALANGTQEDFISLVVWIETATAGKAWKTFSACQWRSIGAALELAYKGANYGYDQFEAAVHEFKDAGISPFPSGPSVDGTG